MKLRLVAVAAVAAFVGLASQAQAAFISTTTEPSGELKMYIDVANKDASEYQGIVGSNVSGPGVDIKSIGNSDTGSGYANIKPAKDTTLTHLTFTPNNDKLFSDFFFDVQLLKAGSVTLNVTSAAGLLQSFTFDNIPKSADTGPLGIVLANLSDTDTIKMVELVSEGFKEVKHIDWSLARVSEVPLPASLPMFGAGLLVLGFLARRKASVTLY